MNRNRSTFVILFSLLINYCSSQSLKRGDNIYDAFSRLAAVREGRMPSIGLWQEESYISAASDSAMPSPDVVYFRAAGKKLIAALNSREKTVAIDMNGDSIIDVETDQL